MHWYLAIIGNPEHVLSLPELQEPAQPSRKSRRISDKSEEQVASLDATRSIEGLRELQELENETSTDQQSRERSPLMDEKGSSESDREHVARMQPKLDLVQGQLRTSPQPLQDDEVDMADRTELLSLCDQQPIISKAGATFYGSSPTHIPLPTQQPAISLPHASLEHSDFINQSGHEAFVAKMSIESSALRPMKRKQSASLTSTSDDTIQDQLLSLNADSSKDSTKSQQTETASDSQNSK